MKKLLRISLLASGLLALLTGARADDSSARQSSWQWASHYYENPRPADFLTAVHGLSRTGYFESVGQPAIAIGFFSEVFAQNPQNVSFWLAQTSDLPETHRRVLAAAAWKAGHPAGARLMNEMGVDADSNVRNELAALLRNGSAPIAETPVLSASSMNLQWGAFLANGDERHIVSVLTALGSDQPGLATSARFALAQNAAAHPRVLDIVRAQLDRQPAGIRAEIRAALNEAGHKPGV
jgi:hypothetical protein